MKQSKTPRRLGLAVITACLFHCSLAGAIALESGNVLVGDVYVNGYDGWTDVVMAESVPLVGNYPAWGVLLTDEKYLLENSDGHCGTSTARTGKYKPLVMANTSYSTPEVYTLSATLASWDNDGFGMVFGYQDYDNYLRIGAREQPNGNIGFAEGASMQTVIDGVITQIAWNSAARPLFDGTPINAVVSVDGTSGAYSLTVDNELIFSGVDARVAGNTEGHYGFHSWFQKGVNVPTSKPRGTVVHSLSVDNGSNSTIDRVHTFDTAVAANWRPLLMTNSDFASDWNGTKGSNTIWGSFSQDFVNGRILDGSNGFTWATARTPNVDFLGPAVVIDDEGSAGWTDYEMTVRVECGDNEGPGVLVRVQDDNTFYRINFAVQTMAWNENEEKRAPAGMSIQKCVSNGDDPPTWTELFRENQANPYRYATATDGKTPDSLPFDLKVKVIGNTITVEVIDDPDGAATPYVWRIVDSTNPILSGSVGFAQWGGGLGGVLGVSFSPYGGRDGTPLLTYIPEPSTLVLLVMGAVGLLFRVRRRRQ